MDSEHAHLMADYGDTAFENLDHDAAEADNGAAAGTNANAANGSTNTPDA